MATPFRFPGFDPGDFETFRIPDRHHRREEIIRLLHPKLGALGEENWFEVGKIFTRRLAGP